jgi:SAM-dependent methyltransferase
MLPDDTDIKADLRSFYDRDVNRRKEKAAQGWKVDHRARFLNNCRESECERLLEVGSGPGRDSRFFVDHGLNPVPVDLSFEMVRTCRSNGLNSAQMDTYDLGFADNTFDCVWSLNVLLHVPKTDIEKVWREIHRVMRPGAIFFLGVYGGIDHEGIYENDWNRPRRFFSRFTDADIQERIQNVFHLVTFERTEIGLPGQHFQALTLRKT